MSYLFASHARWKTGEKNIIFLYSSETMKNLKVKDKFIEVEINFVFFFLNNFRFICIHLKYRKKTIYILPVFSNCNDLLNSGRVSQVKH